MEQRSGAGEATSVPLRDYQLFALGIFEYFKAFCEKHGLTYYLAYGSLLGAARHKGFIPWDDDIDVWMPTDDYYRFRSLCKSELDEKYYFQAHCANAENFISWQRIGVKGSTSFPVKYWDIDAEWGVCIDIFPLSLVAHVGRLKDIETKLLNKAASRSLYRHDAANTAGLNRLYHMALGCHPASLNLTLTRLFEHLSLRSPRFFPGRFRYDLFFTFPDSWFGSGTTLDFEGLEVTVPDDYPSVLDSIYGTDWRSLPPKEKRVFHSGGGNGDVIVSLNTPYSAFQAAEKQRHED